MANLQLKTVSKIYPSGTLALYKANMELSDSEFVAIIGGEKSGKSTLLRVIAGLEEATEGEIIVGGRDVTKVDARDRDLAMIFQGNTLYPALNVFENMAYGLRIRKASSTLIEQRVKVAAEMLGLSDVLYRKPKALTTEQKQLVAFGRAIVREPKLYLLDDPIAGLGGDLKVRLRSVLINLQARMKGTFVYATKNVNEALTMATRVVVLREGMIQQIDVPANLYDYPVNAYVAFLIGSPAINFIDGATIVKEEDKYLAVKGDIKLVLPENIVKRFEKIEEYADNENKVVIGVRPEDMCVGEENVIGEGKVASFEKVEGKGYADCDMGGGISFVVKAEEVAKGSEVKVGADLSHMFVFDGITRLTLLSRDEGYLKTQYADADVVPKGYDEEEAIKSRLKLSPDKKKKK